MDITNTLYVTTAEDWRNWLKKHYRTEKEIWLVYYKKETGKARISYNDAVEQALCFGWIDSLVKTLDAERSVQRFSPRKPGSKYSQANKERLKALVKQRKVNNQVAGTLTDVLKEKFEIPKDILKAIRTDRPAWNNFQKFSKAYQRIRIAYIDGARKRPAEFQKRLRHFTRMTGKNKQFGFGGIEKHY
jgi:uncharacterized protein YdeI (YjbR/CyaY-like superfamily)